MECRKWRKSTDDVFRGSHPPGESIRVPWNRLRWFDEGAVIMRDLGDFWDISVDQLPLDSKCMTGEDRVSKIDTPKNNTVIQRTLLILRI